MMHMTYVMLDESSPRDHPAKTRNSHNAAEMGLVPPLKLISDEFWSTVGVSHSKV